MNTVYNNIFNSPNHQYDISTSIINESQSLTWNNDLGIGFLNPPVDSDEVYDENYWERYRAMIDTDIGRNLTKARIEIANKFNIKPMELLDIGVGNADFCDKFGCRGADINPHAVAYLKKNNKYIDINNENGRWKWMSYHDVLEHIVDATGILAKTDNVMLSVPIHANMESCLDSKHLRPNEHFWHFTVSGMITYMNMFGFKCLYYSTIESKLGRESIGSFVFARY